MKQFKNVVQAYNVLKIDESAKLEDIKKAYLQLAKKYHPDKFANAQDKANAEKHFKEVKEAYDTIVEYIKTKDSSYVGLEDEFDDNFSNFFRKDDDTDEEFFDMNDFYHQYMYEDKQNNKTNFRERYIKDFEKYIKANKISIYDVYLDICNNQPIYKQKLGYHADGMIAKESVYRTYIKSTPDFIKFKMNYKLVKNLDVHINLYYDQSMAQKNLNFPMEYEYKEICSRCDGWGCNFCNSKGYEVKTKKLSVKIPKCGSKATITLKEKGNISPWKKGNIVIHLIQKENLMKQKQKVDFYYEVKKTRTRTATKPVAIALKDSAEKTLEVLKTTWQFLVEHKTHTIYISIITILVIIIILLACLL